MKSPVEWGWLKVKGKNLTLGLGAPKRRCAVGGVMEEVRGLVGTGHRARLPTPLRKELLHSPWH